MEKKEIKLNITKDFWKKMWNLLTPSKKQVKYLMIFVLADEIIQLTSPYIFKLVIDAINNYGPESLAEILKLVGLMVIVEFGVMGLSYLSDKRIFRILVDAEKYLAVNAHEKMMQLSLGYHEKENTGSKVIKIQKGIDKLINLLADMFWQVIPTLIQTALTLCVLFFIDWRFGLVFLMLAPAFAWATLKFNKKTCPMRKARHDGYEEAAGKMAESIININTVQSFVQEDNESREFRETSGKISANALKEFYLMINYNFLRHLIINIGRMAMILFGVYLISKGMITIGSIVFVITITEKSLYSLFRISRLYDRIMESSEAVVRLYDLSKEESDIKNPKNGISPKTIEGTIKFLNVGFSYENDGIKALDGVNTKISQGCVTALVGPSGGGKTTLARMIYRHYDPQEGDVLLDGVNLKKYDLHSFRKFISLVPQEVEIFNKSIKDNIAYADRNADMDQIAASARIANAEEFIDNMPQGYDTLVGERGIKLSGGQRQRIGIARAILADPRILIFDEATSNLDSRSERLIQQALAKISKGRTVIIIAHRLSTIKRADKIIVLENGRVVEEGSHHELAHSGGGLYAKLLSLQQLGDVE